MAEFSKIILLNECVLVIHLGHDGAINEIKISKIFPLSLLDLLRLGGSCCQSVALACLRF